MIVEDRLVHSYIEPRVREIEVRRPSGPLIRTVFPYEASLLVDNCLVQGKVNKGGYLKYLILVKSVQAMYRVLRKVSRDGRSLCAEDSFTVQSRRVFCFDGSTRVYWEPVERRVLAWAPEERLINHAEERQFVLDQKHRNKSKRGRSPGFRS